MANVSKISFKASTPSLLQQSSFTKEFVDKNRQDCCPPPMPRQPRPQRKPSTLSYISTACAVASLIVGVVALRRGNATAAKIKG